VIDVKEDSLLRSLNRVRLDGRRGFLQDELFPIRLRSEYSKESIFIGWEQFLEFVEWDSCKGSWETSSSKWHPFYLDTDKSITALFLGPRGCLSGESIIRHRVGNCFLFSKIKDLVGKNIFPVSYGLKTNRFCKDKGIVLSSGKKMVYELELEDGRKIKATGEHVFFVKDMFGNVKEKRLDSLKEGDRIIITYSNSNRKKFDKKTRKKFSKIASLRTGNKNPFYGHKHSAETRKKLGLKIALYFSEHPEAKKFGRRNYMYGRNGSKNPFYGKKHSEKTRKDLSVKIRKTVKEKHLLCNKGVHIWNVKPHPRGALGCGKPTPREKLLIRFFSKNNLPYKYVGNLSLIVGKKNPDFVHNNKKILIEHFSGRNTSTKLKKIFSSRKQYFKRYGYKTYVIFHEELKNKECLLKKVKDYGYESRDFKS
jgi:hypothetical protein